ncbi:SDR family NAD(P)-dependent oxidoreductase [Yinghuangia seranimata]|uniref:SDR family NAD(P)-dependent oxidoreductase n=1 Tax=Yinghuangia seranimata TaxID=408067 RepID=UPI00248CA59B|nr:SDR family oxidoreductase [Yinghuangia seranimata]MDI2127841.1 SDR family oxidoreductase [Yinghuangia seranimata]
MAKYAGRKAVVVGGATGLGLAIAKRLVEGGARVLLTGGAPDEFADAAAQLGPTARITACDPAEPDAADALAGVVEGAFGALDMLFVTTEADPSGQAAGSGDVHGDRPFAVAAKRAFYAARALAPLVADDGAIVFTTSGADACRPGTPGAGVHAMTASATRALARVLAAELADRGVRVNAVAPGAIDTARETEPASSGARDATRSRRVTTPLGRRGSVEEVARAALFLAADATFTTGTVLAVDGGLASCPDPDFGPSAALG